MAGQKFVVNGKEFILGGSLGDGAAGLVRRATADGDRAEYAVKFLAPDLNTLMKASLMTLRAVSKEKGREGRI